MEAILASVTMITIVSLTKSLDANFLDDCSGNILKNTTTGTYVTDAWFKLGQLYSFYAQVCYNIFLCGKMYF